MSNMDAPAPAVLHGDSQRMDTHYSGEKNQHDFFEDLATYIIVNKNDKNCHVAKSQTQAEHKWSEKSTPEDTKPMTVANGNTTPRNQKHSEEDVNDAEGGEADKYKWKPGFCLQLGSQGRKAMLQLLRNVYKSNKKFKHIFEKMDPPTTISNLPFFKVSMLWELAHELGVFDQAIAIHKIYGKVRHKLVKNGAAQGAPFYEGYSPRAAVSRSPKMRRMPNPMYGPPYYNTTNDDERRFYLEHSNNMNQIKRKVEHLVALNKSTPEEYMNGMVPYKQRKCVVGMQPGHVDNNLHAMQMQSNNMYDYIPRMGNQVYSCAALDCGLIPQ
ncbi:hypothetical protein, conserved [Babesia bigemina]|uniref:Uncharacterized protein n=1 Tax=Babesia bigemina TaxID=5866 RepID=A0A061D782_BABBI|nr:hypothetical protein, conserved [Babesia bigemina]CDR95822.1 hypothetical protein, conserved [Babesia bigemina]|eukprot:XP_012768008.1 hypothetical protein, conserved [Babesia bigemina]